MTRLFSSLAGRILLLAIVAAAILFGVRQCQGARNSATGARVSESQAGAAADTGADAVGTVGAVAGRSADTDKTTMENADAIRNAPGAGAPVDPGVRDAGIDSLCKRAAYRSDPRCL